MVLELKSHQEIDDSCEHENYFQLAYSFSPGGSTDCCVNTRNAIFQETDQLLNTGDYNISW